MVHSEAEDAGGLSPAKDDNEAMRHFIRRTLPIHDCVDYIAHNHKAFYIFYMFLASHAEFSGVFKFD